MTSPSPSDNQPIMAEFLAGPSSRPLCEPLYIKSSTIHPRSAFMQSLAAPYPDFSSITPYTSQHSKSSASDESVYYSDSDTEEHPEITPSTTPDRTESPSEIKVGDIDSEIWRKPLYRPTGIWKGTETSPLVVLEDIPLSAGAASSASVRKGRITIESEDYEFPFICKTVSKSGDMDGFIRELALYKKQLQPLQGEVVPRVINIYPSPGELDILFEPPHPSFWIEATADMPEVLKDRVVDAFDRIHSRGVLHNDVELRHMLIGGDGRVTIIDFEKSKTNVKFPELKLERASRDEVREEIRRVKVKLNYRDARAEEEAIRLEALKAAKNEDEDSSVSRIRELSKQVWNEKWIGPFVQPRRFVMPGQSAEEVQTAIQKFVNEIDRLERGRTSTQGEPTTPPSSPKESHSRNPLPLTISTRSSFTRKRRSTDDASSSKSSKRRHVQAEEPAVPVTRVPATAVELPRQHSVTSTLIPRSTSPLPPPPRGLSSINSESCSTSSLIPLEPSQSKGKRRRDIDYEDDLPDERQSKTIHAGGPTVGSISVDGATNSAPFAMDSAMGTIGTANSTIIRTQPRPMSPERVLKRRSHGWVKRILNYFACASP